MKRLLLLKRKTTVSVVLPGANERRKTRVMDILIAFAVIAMVFLWPLSWKRKPKARFHPAVTPGVKEMMPDRPKE